MPRTKSRAPRRARADQTLRSEARDSTQEWLEDRLGRLPELEIRRMFGGAGIYAEGTMFGILHAGRLYLKTNESTRAPYTERGMGPFRPRRGAVLKSYYEVPAEILDDDGELLSFAREALSIADVAPTQSKARTVSPEQILEGYPSEIRELAHRVRKLVLAVAPDAAEAGYAGWRLVGYRCPHYFCFVAPQADHVRLGFEHGNRLLDPDGLLEPMGKQVRFVRLAPGKRLPVSGIRNLLQWALQTKPERRKP
jgi:DNA transformation protein and related proteins